MQPKYSFLKGLGKSLLQFVVFSFPFFVQMLPHDWMNLTVGAILSLAGNYLKVKSAEAEPTAI